MCYVITDDGGLFDYSVKPGPDLSRSWQAVVSKARFGQVGDQVPGQGPGWSRPGPGGPNLSYKEA